MQRRRGDTVAQSFDDADDYRHGLRVSELVALRRDDVNLRRGRVWIWRLKNGLLVERARAWVGPPCGSACIRRMS